jgi:hypothetical protein
MSKAGVAARVLAAWMLGTGAAAAQGLAPLPPALAGSDTAVPPRPATVVSLRPGPAKGNALGFPLHPFDAGRGSLRILLPLLPASPAGTDATWEIRIYDGRRRNVWSLTHPGAMEVVWNGAARDGSALPDGNYFLGLFRDGKAVTAQRVQLMREQGAPAGDAGG